jgi:hypothetical protein
LFVPGVICKKYLFRCKYNLNLIYFKDEETWIRHFSLFWGLSSQEPRQTEASGGGFCNIVATTMRSSGKEGFLGGFLDIIEVGVALMGRRGGGGGRPQQAGDRVF